MHVMVRLRMGDGLVGLMVWMVWLDEGVDGLVGLSVWRVW
jgi:hypothetical protein